MDINVESTGGFHGETNFDREITAEQYSRALQNNNRLTEDDFKTVLTEAERIGYGATAYGVYQKRGKYYVCCHRYNNCD